MARKQTNNMVISVLLLVMLAGIVVATWGASDGDILLKFKNSLSNDAVLDNWHGRNPPCTGDTANWSALRCLNGSVYGLRLEMMSLMGVIDMDSLDQLPGLRSLSLMYNRFDGPMPDVKRVSGLRSLHLSYNKFSGEIPENAFTDMKYLRKVHLARNQFSGKIPSSLAALVQLVELNLEGNQFSGKIPDFLMMPHLTMLNISNNQLVGQIPATLSHFNSSSFSGNKGLCGKPLKDC